MKVRNYQDLIVWQKAMELVEEVYRFSKPFPRDEIFGLTSQLRRAAVSIPSNIAEGQGRRSTADFLRHLSIAYGSLREVETQVLISTRLEYQSPTNTNNLVERTDENRKVAERLNELTKAIKHVDGE